MKDLEGRVFTWTGAYRLCVNLSPEEAETLNYTLVSAGEGTLAAKIKAGLRPMIVPVKEVTSKYADTTCKDLEKIIEAEGGEFEV